MAYIDFLEAFALAQKIPDSATLLADHSIRYGFQIKSRERAVAAVQKLRPFIGDNLTGKRVLDVGCAYGAFSVEFAKLGCHVVGIDVNEKWLSLAEPNARNEADCEFINCDASSFAARALLQQHGPFDIIIINDVFEHIYDTAGLLDNLRHLISPDGIIYFKVPNGMATRSVISEGHKKVFGISLLAPDYWGHFVDAPFSIYYRREAYFDALFGQFGFSKTCDMVEYGDVDREFTVRAIRSDMSKIKKLLRKENFEKPIQYKYIRNAAKYYFMEIASDIETADTKALFRKYRATFWTGIVKVTSMAEPGV